MKDVEIAEKLYKIYCDFAIRDAMKVKDWNRVVTLRMAKWATNPDRFWKDPFDA